LGKPRQSYGEVVLREKVSVPLPRKIKEEILAQGGHVCILTARSSHDSHTPLDGANPRRTAVFLDDAAPPLPQGRQHPHVRLRHRPGPEPEGPAGADGVWVDRVPHHGAGFGELGPQFSFSADAVRPHALYQEYTHLGIHLTDGDGASTSHTSLPSTAPPPSATNSASAWTRWPPSSPGASWWKNARTSGGGMRVDERKTTGGGDRTKAGTVRRRHRRWRGRGCRGGPSAISPTRQRRPAAWHTMGHPCTVATLYGEVPAGWWEGGAMSCGYDVRVWW